MRIPLSNRLRRKAHAEIAALQDEVVEALYAAFPETKFVLRGGTAVWRCYGGNRFSEDLDFFTVSVLPPGFKESFFAAMRALGLEVTKFKRTANTVFAKISGGGGVEIRVEVSTACGAEKRGVSVAEFEKADGGVTDVYALSAYALLKEKMAAFASRRFARDFYDVYFLSRLVEFDAVSRRELKEFLRDAKPPVDEQNLEVLVFSGVAPSFKQMVEVLSSRAGRGGA